MLDSPDQTALRAAFDALLKPLARLALSRGLPYTAMDELLRAALVNEAILLNANTPAHGMVSRVSTATGLNRREVGRLLAAAAGDGGAAAQRWLSGELFARWMTDPDYLQAGKPLRLARQGAAPSFESLAQSITRDVHPRALLEELCRLGLAQWNAQDDTVGLQRDAFVPRADFTRMVALLADNVGDHLHASVDNVLGDGEAHFEQAIYGDELSQQSVQALQPLITAQWTQMYGRLIPALERLIADDQAAGRPQDQRVRIGLYSFNQAMTHTVQAGHGAHGGQPAHSPPLGSPADGSADNLPPTPVQEAD